MVILRLRIKTADEWRELAPGEAVAEPIFVPTTDELQSGQSVIVEVSSNLLPNKVLIRGAVQSWRPALPRMRVRAGATVQLDTDEQIKLTFLHDVLSGKRTDVSRRGHSRLPVQFACRYRVANSSRVRRLRDLARSASAVRCSPPSNRCRSTPSSRSRSRRPVRPRRSRSRAASRITRRRAARACALSAATAMAIAGCAS